MDYTQLFDRWIALTTLSEKDLKDLIGNLHEEVVSGAQTLASLACSEISRILEEATYSKRNEYLEAVAPVATLSALDGYLFFLMGHNINPSTAHLASHQATNGLGKRWSAVYEKDQSKSYLDKIDPIIVMMLQKIQDLRVNQIVSFHPKIVDLPYKVTERSHQYLGWCVHQGYVMGALEQEIARV